MVEHHHQMADVANNDDVNSINRLLIVRDQETSGQRDERDTLMPPLLLSTKTKAIDVHVFTKDEGERKEIDGQWRNNKPTLLLFFLSDPHPLILVFYFFFL